MVMEERVYRYSRISIISTLVPVCALALLTVLANFKPDLIVSLLTIYAVLYALHVLRSKVTISDAGLQVQKLWGTKELGWAEIARTSGFGSGLKLHNKDEDVTLSLDSQVQGYAELIDTIGEKRPDLFETEKSAAFAKTPAMLIFPGLLAFMFIAWGLVLLLFARGTEWYPGIFLLVIGLVYAAALFFMPLSMAVDTDGFAIQYPFRRKTISLQNIQSVELKSRSSRNASAYHVELSLDHGKKIKISGFKGGAPGTYLVLKRWLIRHRQPTVQPGFLAAYSTGSESKGEPGWLA